MNKSSTLFSRMIMLSAILLLTGTIAAGALASDINTISLPDELKYPEGIAHDNSGHIYTASAEDGTVLRYELNTGNWDVLIAGDVLLPEGDVFPGLLGMKVDSADRLWLTGGRTGKIFVIDTDNSNVIKSMAPPEAGLLNDVVVAAGAAYVTDTIHPRLWKIPLNGADIGEPEVWIELQDTPIHYDEGRNLNGIAMTPDGKTLIVVQMDKGLLFKIDVDTKTITPIDVAGEILTNGDGLVLDGNTLYVIRQADEEIVTVQLDPGFASGKVISRFTDPALQWTATAAKVGDELLVVNVQQAVNQRSHHFQLPLFPFPV